MQFAQMNFLLPIRVQLLITVQNDDKKYLLRHNNNTIDDITFTFKKEV